VRVLLYTWSAYHCQVTGDNVCSLALVDFYEDGRNEVSECQYKKNLNLLHCYFDPTFIRLDRVPACARQTDRQTELN